MNTDFIRGVVVPMITPIDGDERIDEAAFAQAGAAAPGKPTALDTHWIWQDGQNLLKDAPQIKDGYLEVPEKQGLGVTLDMAKVEEANRLYNSLPTHDRDDAVAMQCLIPGWKYNNRMPALVR